MHRRAFLASPLALAQAPYTAALIADDTGDHLSSYVKPFAKLPGPILVASPQPATFDLCRKVLGPDAHRLVPYPNYAAMLAERRPAVTVITVEPHRAPERAIAALKSGSHVMVEKPPCVREEEIVDMARAADANGKQLMLAMATRSSPAIVMAKKLMDGGAIGKPLSVTMNWIADHTRTTRPAFQSGWHASKKRAGGGKLVYHGIHYLDLLTHLTGDQITRVHAILHNVGGTPIETEDSAVLSFLTKGGIAGTLNAGYYLDKGYERTFHLWGSKGWIRFSPPAPLEWYSHDKGLTVYSDMPQPDMYGAMLDHIFDPSRKPFMTTSESLALMRTVFAAYRTAASGSPLLGN